MVGEAVKTLVVQAGPRKPILGLPDDDVLLHFSSRGLLAFTYFRGYSGCHQSSGMGEFIGGPYDVTSGQ